MRCFIFALVTMSSLLTTTAAVADDGSPTPELQALWAGLERHSGTHLRLWWAVADTDGFQAEVALDAFRQLVYRFTAPGGMWRSEAPRRWFGCRAYPTSPACKAHAAATPELARWDELVEQTQSLAVGGAERFVREHVLDLLAYLDRYVPRWPGVDGARATPFFRDRLAAAADLPPIP